MKVLMAHTFYQQPGGEDKCFRAESELLRQGGHELRTFTLHNDALSGMNGLKAATAAVWNRQAHKELTELIGEQRPDVVHLHNSFPLMSPAVLWAAKAAGCAVVVTLHNFRLICPAAVLLRDGRVCEDCLGRSWPWPGVLHGCYRDSLPASAVVATTLTAHRILGTWRDKVDRFVALSGFARDKLIEGGLAPDKIALKPNFLDPDPGPGSEPSDAGEGYALYVGRLSPEKGIESLLAAWESLPAGPALRVVGDGPLAPQVAAATARVPGLEALGYQESAAVMDLMAGADFLVVPSICYETFGLTVVEAFARARPVIAARLGALAELVEDGRTGLHFEAGNPDDLASKVTWAREHPAEMRAMGEAARAVYLERYGAERNYETLLEIYRAAMASAAS